MPNYIDIIYNDNSVSYTKYPDQLCAYLFDKFKMEKGQKFLDLGCGRGDFSRGFLKLGLNVFGLDLEKSLSSLNLLKDIQTEYVNFEKDRFPFKDASFDIIFSKSVIEHIGNPENFIKESMRVLRPGGKIIILTPDWKSQCFVFYDDYTHVHPYNLLGLTDLLKIFGFTKVNAEEFYQLPFLWKNPLLKKIFKFWKIFGPVKKIYKNKLIRWSRELMILAYAEK